jgi:Bacteriophage HK97-gp10, putative tail-component
VTERVEIVGWDAAARDMNRYAAAVADAVDKAAVPLAGQAADRVRGAVPHHTGRLAGSVRVVTDPDGVAVTMGAGVPYAGWVEYGGTRGRAYDADGRYLWPTVEGFTDAYTTLAADTAERTAERFPWSQP